MKVFLLCFFAWTLCHSSAAQTAASRNEIIEDDRSIELRQQAGTVASSDFLRRAFHGSVVARNWVYIDGGDFSYILGGVPQYEYSTTILSIDLSTSWTNSSIVINSNFKPSDVPNLDDPSLWYNAKDNVLYSGFAGLAPRFNTPSPSPLGLWSYALDGQGGGTWSAVSTPTAQLSSSFTRPFEGMTAYGGDSAYTIGGLVLSGSSPATVNLTSSEPISGIVQYNMTTGAFTNSSASGYNWNGTSERGVLHYVPSFGPEGLFVLLGGDNSGLDEDVPGHNLPSFANLAIFDPSTGNFYNQTATGNIPESRIEFCAAGVNSTNGTYEIFIYAGWGSELGSAALPFDEIYILTLPAFEWLKVDYPPAHPRHGHTCHTVGNRQMLVIGGVDSLQYATSSDATTLNEATFATKDNFTQGLGIFDMTALTWSSGYDASAPQYEQSSLVTNYYAQNSREPATWGSSSLQNLFQITHFTNTTTSTTPSSTPSTMASHHHSNTGAIAGGVVGGIVVLLAFAGLGIFLHRRSQHRKRNVAELSGQAAHTAAELANYKSQEPLLEAPADNSVARKIVPGELDGSQQHEQHELP